MNEKKDVEDACHDDNRRKLSQSSNTPLIHRQIYQEIGYDGTSEIFLKIMQGHWYAPPDTDYYTTAYTKYLIRAPNII